MHINGEGNKSRSKSSVTLDLLCMGEPERLKDQMNMPDMCTCMQSSVGNSNTPENVSVMSVKPNLSARVQSHAQQVTEGRKSNGHIGHVYTCAESCDQLEKACKHVRHGHKTPKQLGEIKLIWCKPKIAHRGAIEAQKPCGWADHVKEHANQWRRPKNGWSHKQNCQNKSSKAKNDKLTYRMWNHNGQTSQMMETHQWCRDPNDSMIFYILTTILATFDPANPQTYGGRVRWSLAMDKSMISFMKNKLCPSSNWKDLGLKAVITLKWTLFMTETCHRNPSLKSWEGFKMDELESQIWSVVQGDSFTYLVTALV